MENLSKVSLLSSEGTHQIKEPRLQVRDSRLTTGQTPALRHLLVPTP